MNRLIFSGLWLFFSLYAFVLAPPNDPATLDLIINLAEGSIEGINPLIVALFNLMGILPVIYACLLLVDGRGQKLPAWIFVIGSFGLGAFALLPYFAFREEASPWIGKTDWLLKILESRLTAMILMIATLSLIFWGLNDGDWASFIQLWQNTKFIHIMSLDFCCLCLCLPFMIKADLQTRGIRNPAIFAIISFIPLFGPLVYLCCRPRLIAVES